MTNFTVNQTTDDGTGLTAGTLSYAILQANQLAGDDTITINNDVRFTGVVKTLVNSNITIVGNNHSISGDANNNGINDNGDVRSLFILSGTVGISNLTITNGRAKGGDSNPGGGGGFGGGLFIYDGNVTLTNVGFTNNAAQGGSGGVSGLSVGGGGMFGDAGGIGGGGLFAGSTNSIGGYGGNGNYGGSANGGFGGGGYTGGGGGFGGGGRRGGYSGYSGNGGNGGNGGGGGRGGLFGFGAGNGGNGGGGAGNGPSASFGGGGAGLGGGIFVRTGFLTLNNTSFTNNTATGCTGINSGQGLGGAIFIMQSTTNTNGNNQGMPTTLGTVSFTGSSTFSGNSAANDAGTATNNDDVYGTQIPPTNQAPVAVDDSASTFFATTVNIPVTTLLANDTDVDGDPLSITAVSGATNGTAVLNNNGTPSNTADDFIVFTPTTGFSGNASFDYTLSDGSLTDIGNVTVAVGTNLSGGNGDDLLNGTAGNDSLSGGNGQDTLNGTAGNDTLNGGNGADDLTGGTGNDILTGGSASDTFIFAALDGTDTITDFNDGLDYIGLSGGLTFGQLSFSGSNIIVTSTNEILATLTGINTTNLTAADFMAI